MGWEKWENEVRNWGERVRGWIERIRELGERGSLESEWDSEVMFFARCFSICSILNALFSYVIPSNKLDFLFFVSFNYHCIILHVVLFAEFYDVRQIYI